MLGVTASDPRRERRAGTDGPPVVLHLALSRSAAVKLASVASAMPGPQALVDPAGRLATWAQSKPPVACEPLRSPADVAGAVAEALETTRPDAVLVAGDGDAALAGTLAAVRAGVPVARLGAGLRCGDRGVVREINRIAIDGLAARLYTDSELADDRLRSEGADERRIQRVGSTVADVVGRWGGPAVERAAWARVGMRRGRYVLVSLRRRETFADPQRLAEAVITLARRAPVAFCVEGRSRDALASGGHLRRLVSAGVTVVGSLPYVDFLSLQAGAGAVVTDSAGVQEETTLLGVACFTLARSSERTLTLTQGQNVLLGDDPVAIEDVAIRSPEAAAPLPMWDGEAGRRIAGDLLDTPWEDG